MRKTLILILECGALAILSACSAIASWFPTSSASSSPRATERETEVNPKGVAADNELLAYLAFSPNGGRFDITLADVDKQGANTCLTCQFPGSAVQMAQSNQQWFAWSPDHTKIAFMWSRLEGQTFYLDLFVANTDGGTRLLRTWETADIPEPLAWSPDGRRVLVFFPVTPLVGLYVVDSLNGTETDYPATESGVSPVWIDNRTVAYVDHNGPMEIHTVKLDNPKPSVQAQFGFSADLHVDPVWSPRLDKIFVIGDQVPRVANTNGRTLYEVASAGTRWLPEVSWSPDGNQLAIAGIRDGAQGSDIYVIDVRTGVTQALTDSHANDMTPSWSPSGTRIAFFRLFEGIYVMNADGTGGRLVVPSSDGSNPIWK